MTSLGHPSVSVRAAVSPARRVLRGVQRLLPASNRGLLILAYHLVDGGTQSAVDISLAMLRAHMEMLRSKARLLSLSEAVTEMCAKTSEQSEPAGGSAAPPQTTVVVTFDDAYRNFRTHAWPVLRELQIPTTLYVPVDFVERNAPPPIRHPGLEPCTWDDLREMLREGPLEIGSHTCSHPNLRRVASTQLEHEIGGSRRVLEERLVTSVTSFCYPQAKWSLDAERVVQQHYRNATVGGGIRNDQATASPYRLNRVSIRRDMGAELERILHAPVWLEEWISDRVRQIRA